MAKYKGRVWEVIVNKEERRLVDVADHYWGKIIKLTGNSKKFEVSFWQSEEAANGSGVDPVKELLTMTKRQLAFHGFTLEEDDVSEESENEGQNEHENEVSRRSSIVSVAGFTFTR